ncbi:MAG TPA: 3-isopropylmalate dehydrogenase [Vicinamibacterales bacterium]|nr:3-isopropylmalate dehydrogenase [Vicinamibacterales bacterium]
MSLNVVLLPGDGIGPEVTAEAARLLGRIGELYRHAFRLITCPVGGAAIEQEGSSLPARTLDACLVADAVLLGAVGHPRYEDRSPADRPEAGLLALRKALGGFANLRPAACHPALADRTPFRTERVQGADILIVRELLGGLYFGEPRGYRDPETAFNTLVYSKSEVERVARVAFDLARGRRRRVSSIDKANVLETSRLWRNVVTEVGRDYPDVALEHVYVDTCAMRMATNPASFDVILADNLFGDILSDQAASVAGSLGVLPSASIGGRVDLYEPVHGSAPDIAGQGLANPIGAIASVAMLLRHSARLPREAQAVEQAIDVALASGARTRDLAGPGETSLSTREMGDAIEHALVELFDRHHTYHAV